MGLRVKSLTRQSSRSLHHRYGREDIMSKIHMYVDICDLLLLVELAVFFVCHEETEAKIDT